MTTPYGTSGPAPGWYQAPDGSPRQQWWDGRAWTGNFSGSYQPAMPQARTPISGQTPVYNPFIWLVVLLPLIPLSLLLFWNPVLKFRYTGPYQTRTLDPFSVFTPVYFLAIGSAVLVYAVCVLMAYLDWQRLRNDGVIRPFHWAWVFISATVYIVGRSVIVHGVAKGRGLAPVWTLIAITVVGVLAVVIKEAALFSSMSTNFTQ
jgi:hypothetical protein